MNNSTYLKVGVTGGLLVWLLHRLKILRHKETKRYPLGGRYCTACGGHVDDDYVSTNRAKYVRSPHESIERNNT